MKTNEKNKKIRRMEEIIKMKKPEILAAVYTYTGIPTNKHLQYIIEKSYLKEIETVVLII